MGDESLTSVEARLIGATVDAMRIDVGEMKADIKDMTTALAKLTALEQKYIETSDAMSRAFGRIENIESRLRPIEVSMPQLIETRKWVVTMGLAALSLMLLAIVTLVLRSPTTIVPVPIIPNAKPTNGAVAAIEWSVNYDHERQAQAPRAKRVD
jgi:hypothetical protein